MDKDRESQEGGAVSKGVWSAQLYDHIKYFNEHPDLREIKVVLPFGLRRERKPKDWNKKKGELAEHSILDRICQTKLGMFYKQPGAEEKEWRPRLKTVEDTRNDQIQYKPSVFVLRNDPLARKEMYFEQDLMAKPIPGSVDKRNGFTYRLDPERSVVIRKYLVMLPEAQIVEFVQEFVNECNRILIMYCNNG